MVSIEEIIAAIHQIQGVSSEVKEKKIAQVLESLDKDHDGKIDDLNDVIKVSIISTSVRTGFFLNFVYFLKRYLN
jgi:hypothetical protein